MTGKPMTKVTVDPDMKEKSERRMLDNEKFFRNCRGKSY